MLTLPPKFKQALGNGVRTSLYPLVRIYKGIQIDEDLNDATEIINLSIKETNIDGEAYNPLLLNAPSIKSSADIINNKYTISSVSLSISNALYKGKMFSDDVPTLLNSVTQVYYAANGLDSLDDCLLVYTGTIRRYSQSAESIKLTLEDLTEQKLTTKVPATLIEDDEYHREDDIGKPYPMVYGLVDKSPVIFNTKNILEIDKPNQKISGYWGGASQIDFGNPAITDGHPLIENQYLRKNSILNVYNDGYTAIPQNVVKDWGSRPYEGLDIDSQIYTITENPNSDECPSVDFNTDAFIYEKWDADIESGVGKQGIISRLYRPITSVTFYATKHPSVESENYFIGYQKDNGGLMDVIQEGFGNDNTDSDAVDNYNNFWSNYTTGSFDFWQPTTINENFSGESEIESFQDDQWMLHGHSDGKFPVEWIQNNNYDEDGRNLSGLHIYCMSDTDDKVGCFARLKFDDNVGSFPCVTKIFYDISYFTITNIQSAFSSEPAKFWFERNLKENGVGSFMSVNIIDHTDIYNIINGQYDDYGVNEQTWAWHTGADNENSYCHVPNHNHDLPRMTHIHNDAARFENEPYDAETYSGGILNSEGLDNNTYKNIITDFNTTNASDSIQFGAPTFKAVPNVAILVNLKEVYVLQDTLIADLETRDFYVDIAGRTTPTDIPSVVYEIAHFQSNNEYTQSVLYTETEHQMEVGDVFDFWNYNDDYLGEFTVHEANSPTILVVEDERLYPFTSGRLVYKKPLFIQDAKTIMSDILQNELLYEGDIEAAPDIQEDWTYAFSLTEQKEAKQIFEGLFKSSLLIPSFNSAGQFKFIGIKQIIENYNDVESINTEDVVKYSFSLTKLDDIYNIVNVKYKKDFGADEFDKETGYIIKDAIGNEYDGYESLTTDGLGYTDSAYNLSYYGLSPEDAKLEVESEYIRDEYTAQKLQKRLLMWYCNQHLITKIDLPPHYMHLEAGDHIRFTDLIGGKLAFGYDYTVSEQRNGQLIYPAFFITKVSKSLSKISIEAVQVHRGEYGFPSEGEEDSGDIVDGNNNDQTENWDLGDPSDDPNYNDESINTEEYEDVIDPFLQVYIDPNTRNLTNGQVIAWATTNMEESWEYNLWVTTVTTPDGNGITYLDDNNNEQFIADGTYDIGVEPADGLVEHNLTMSGNNGYITLNKKFVMPENTYISFQIEVNNTQFNDQEYFVQYGESEPEPILGDTNGDGIVNVLDIVQMVQAILNDTTDDLPETADVTLDGIINVLDVVKIIDYIVTGEWDLPNGGTE